MATIYNSGKLAISEGKWSTDDHYAILVTQGYTLDASHSTLADLITWECTDSDYSPQDLSNEATTESGGIVVHSCDDIDFGDPITIVAAGVAILKGTAAGKNTTDELIGFQYFQPTGADQSIINSGLIIRFSPSGVFRLI